MDVALKLCRVIGDVHKWGYGFMASATGCIVPQVAILCNSSP